VKLRKWQADCLESFVECRSKGAKTFVFEACPGAGKSFMAAKLSEQMLAEEIDFILVVVPWTSIQGSEFSGMIKTFDQLGIHVRDKFFVRGARIVAQPYPRNVQAVVTTYHEVMNQNTVDVLKAWKRQGLKFAVIFDEIHHTNETGGQWGEYADQIHQLATMTVVMSGTYFRSDRQPIRFVDYNEDGRPLLSCPGYTYTDGVRDRVVRPVSFRYHDPQLRCHHESNGEELHNLSGVRESDRRFGKVKSEVLHPEGECVRSLIMDVDAFMAKTRGRFRDAGALFTCRPGGDSNEDRHVHAIAAKVRQITGQEVIEVTHHDRNAAGKIEQFRNGTAPYLVAVNMVSEGVDIPRLRAVAMMRYINSEMLFRQIVGRAVRMTEDEDGTAAGIFLPKFEAMYRFGTNLEGESLAAVESWKCPTCGLYPCECPCEACGEFPCKCISCIPPIERHAPGFEVLEVMASGGGGSVGADDVAERSIEVARMLSERYNSHRHANPVQLAHAIEKAYPIMGGVNERVGESATPLERLNTSKRRVLSLIGKIAAKFYGGDFERAWVECLMKPYGTDWKTARITWSIEQIEKFSSNLETIITKGK
jgi:hypothetical protein